jgi:hypothetical protein
MTRVQRAAIDVGTRGGVQDIFRCGNPWEFARATVYNVRE